MKYDIERVLVVSTAHIAEEDNNKIQAYLKNEPASLNPLVVYEYEFGYYIYVPQDKELFKEDLEIFKTLLSADFCKLYQITHEQDCHYLKLDCDGLIYDHLHENDW